MLLLVSYPHHFCIHLFIVVRSSSYYLMAFLIFLIASTLVRWSSQQMLKHGSYFLLYIWCQDPWFTGEQNIKMMGKHISQILELIEIFLSIYCSCISTLPCSRLSVFIFGFLFSFTDILHVLCPFLKWLALPVNHQMESSPFAVHWGKNDHQKYVWGSVEEYGQLIHEKYHLKIMVILVMCEISLAPESVKKTKIFLG